MKIVELLNCEINNEEIIVEKIKSQKPTQKPTKLLLEKLLIDFASSPPTHTHTPPPYPPQTSSLLPNHNTPVVYTLK